MSALDAICTAQGFDKYGIWRVDALAAPNLKAALKLKVSPSQCTSCSITVVEYHLREVKRPVVLQD